MAPVLASSAYQNESPPPTYTTPPCTVAPEVIPAVTGKLQFGSVVWPRLVFQMTAPVVALSAYSKPSHEPMYTTPLTTAGDDTTELPVKALHLGPSVGALAALITASV